MPSAARLGENIYLGAQPWGNLAANPCHPPRVSGKMKIVLLLKRFSRKLIVVHLKILMLKTWKVLNTWKTLIWIPVVVDCSCRCFLRLLSAHCRLTFNCDKSSLEIQQRPKHTNINFFRQTKSKNLIFPDQHFLRYQNSTSKITPSVSQIIVFL